MSDNTSSIFPLGGGGSGGGAAGSIVIGNPVTGGGANRVLYEDGSQNLAASAAFSMDGTTIESSLQTNISGPDSSTNVEIGSNANNANGGTGGTSVVIGNAATNSANSAGVVAIGSSATVATAGVNAIVIGPSSSITNSTRAIAIGSVNVISAAAETLALGAGISGLTASEVAITNNNGSGYVNYYLGKGKTNGTPIAITVQGTGGSGTDIAGGSISICGGKGTGSGAGGNVTLQASQRLATGTTLQTLYDRHVVVAGTKTLTAAAATGVVRIGVPQGLTGPVGVTIFYAIRASDGTDFQLRRGSVHIAAVNKAGTETAVISAASEVLDGSVIAQSSASTLTYALTVASNAADTIDFEINAVSGLAETTLDVQYTVIRDHGVGTITPL